MGTTGCATGQPPHSLGRVKVPDGKPGVRCHDAWCACSQIFEEVIELCIAPVDERRLRRGSGQKHLYGLYHLAHQVLVVFGYA